MNYNEEQKLTNELIILSIDSNESLNIDKTGDDWIDSLIDTSFEQSEEVELIKENTVIPKPNAKRNYFHEFKTRVRNYSTKFLNNCRQDNLSLIKGFLAVAAISCLMTVFAINLSDKEDVIIPTSGNRFQAESRYFNRRIMNTTNSQSQATPNQHSSNELSDSQIEEILKYYFQYQQGSSNQNNEL